MSSSSISESLRSIALLSRFSISESEFLVVCKYSDLPMFWFLFHINFGFKCFKNRFLIFRLLCCNITICATPLQRLTGQKRKREQKWEKWIVCVVQINRKRERVKSAPRVQNMRLHLNVFGVAESKSRNFVQFEKCVFCWWCEGKGGLNTVENCFLFKAQRKVSVV